MYFPWSICRLERGRLEPDAEVFQFLEGRQQIRYRPAPTVQSPDQHHIDLPAAGGFQQFLAGLSPRRPGVHLVPKCAPRPELESRGRGRVNSKVMAKWLAEPDESGATITSDLALLGDAPSGFGSHFGSFADAVLGRDSQLTRFPRLIFVADTLGTFDSSGGFGAHFEYGLYLRHFLLSFLAVTGYQFKPQPQPPQLSNPLNSAPMNTPGSKPIPLS
jgi:hypothetical protein